MEIEADSALEGQKHPPGAAKPPGASDIQAGSVTETRSLTETHSTTRSAPTLADRSTPFALPAPQTPAAEAPQAAQPASPAQPAQPASSPAADSAKAAQPVPASKPSSSAQAAPTDSSHPPTRKKGLIVGIIVLAVIAVLAIGILLGRLWGNSKKDPNMLVLFGNVDLRQVELAFNNSERIGEVLVEEGDRIARGQVLARLDTSRLGPKAAAAEAEVDAQRAVVQRLKNGSRPEEIAQAQANVALAQADQLNADLQWKRVSALAALTTGRAISQQDIDNAKAALDTAQARLAVAQKGLDLSMIGPRPEDIAQGEALLRYNQAQLDILRRELGDAELVSPCDAVVRSRLLEPGEMISPQRPVFDLSISDPKWIRTYVSEPELGRIHTGMKASISTDSFPGRTLSGWVGFISSVAEFTPKAVQTEDLRPGLVYEIRVFVKDPQDEMRLGMPATVSLELAPAPQGQP
jgi:HlyD family secretion protein